MTTQAFAVTSSLSIRQRVQQGSPRNWLRLAALFGILCALGPFALVSHAQSYQTALGIPPFMTALPVENGSIDASTGNLHIEIPLGSFPQRGLAPLRASLVYNSAFWVNGGGVWQPSYGSTAGWGLLGGGWQLMISGVPSGSSPTLDQVTWTSCPGGAGWTVTESPWSWTSADGTEHIFPITLVGTTGTPCATPVTSGDAFATDSSGYHMFINNTTNTTTIYTPDGSLVYNAPATGNGQRYDTNGNYLNGVYPVQDTLGRTPFVLSASCPTGYTYCVSVPNSTGGTSQYNIQVANISMSTSFGVSGITECSTTCGAQVITGVTLPDGTAYSFTYDQTPGTGKYGELASMTTPTGATINYTYTNYTDSYGNMGRWIASRTIGTSSWSYAPSVVSTCTSTSVGCEQTVTVTQPSTDQEVYTFELDNGAWPIQMQSYNGSVSSGNLLATQTTAWDFTHSCTTPTGCLGHFYITKLSDTATLPIPGSTSLSRTTQYTYDTSTNDGNITTVKEWNFYSGSLPSTPSRITNMTYLTGSAYAAVNIMNRPASVIVTDGTGSTQYSKTLYTYDATSPGLTSATGFVNHDDTDYGTSYLTRGNLTQVQKWISGSSSYLTSSLVYDTTGQVVSATGPAGNTTTLSYTDSFYNDASTPTNYYPSTPTHAYLTQVTQPTVGSNSFVSNFSYYYGTGQIAQSTDVNGQISYAHYLDPFSRPTSSIPPVGWSLTNYTSATQVDSYTGIATGSTPPSSCFPDASCTTAPTCTGCLHSQVDLDSLGRPQYSEVVNNPAGTTTSQTSYDSNGRPYNVTAPNFPSGSITAADTTAYDGLNRPTVISHADTTASYAYYGSAITSAGGNGTQQCGPPTSTCPYGYPVLSIDEAGKLHETWTDGFGRLVEVDEPAALPATAGGATGTSTGTEQSVSGSATAGHGTVTIGGSEQSTEVEVDPTCTLYDCGGDCIRWSNGSLDGSPTYNTVYDYGTVSIAVNGHPDSASYGSSSTSSSIASALNTAINLDSSASVTSTVSGSVLTLTAKTTGSSTNYTFSATPSTSDPTDFGSGSFTTGYSSPLTGGAPGGSPTYDSGTVSLTVNSITDTVSYNSSSTASSVASALAVAITGDSSASVNATASGATVTLTARTTGSGTNYTVSPGHTTSNPTLFSSPSFSISIGTALSGGANATTPSLSTPNVTNYIYDVAGNLLQVNQGVQTRTYTYDGLGRTLTAKIPETTVSGVQQPTTSNYDGDSGCSSPNSFPGQLVSTVDARGVKTCMQYDALGRVTQVNYNLGSSTGVTATSTVSYTYDSGGSSANALGRLTSMSDGSGSETYTYDVAGRVTALAKVIGGSTYTTSYAYNAGSEPTSISYPSGTMTVQSSYNAIGQLCGVGPSGSTCTSTTMYANGFAYNAPGQVTGFTYGNGVTASMGYSLNRLQMSSLAYAKSSTTLLSLNYYYAYNSGNCATGTTGNNGQIQCIGDITSTAAAGRSAAYTYDELGRLSSALTAGSTGSGSYSQWGLAFTYDRYGNLLKEQSSGSANTTCIAVSASTNQVTGTCALPSLSTYSYDANGNMLGDGVNSSMTYDAANHLISLYNSTSGGAAYVYDGNGNRVKKCVPSCSGSNPTTVYIFSGSKVIAEYDNGAAYTAPTRQYLFAGGLKVATVDTATTYHLRDHLSVRVNTNSSGAIIGEQGHYPFGDIWYPLNTTTKEMFTTYERDPETGNGSAGTGNDYAMARYNVNRLGRFSSVDPLSGNISNPQSLNHYAYVTNDPINGTDPTGMAGGDAYAQAIDPCATADPTTGAICTGQGDSVSGEGGSDAWGLSWWNAQWGWTQWDEGTTTSTLDVGGSTENAIIASLDDGPTPTSPRPIRVLSLWPLCDPQTGCQPYDMSALAMLVPRPNANTLNGGPSNAGGSGGNTIGPQRKRPFNSVVAPLPDCGTVALKALGHGFNQATSPLSPSGGSPEELMATGTRTAMAQYVVARGLVVPLRSSIFRALGAVAEGLEILPIAQLSYAFGYADVKLYQAKFQDHSCK